EREIALVARNHAQDQDRKPDQQRPYRSLGENGQPAQYTTPEKPPRFCDICLSSLDPGHQPAEYEQVEPGIDNPGFVVEGGEDRAEVHECPKHPEALVQPMPAEPVEQDER